MVGDEEPAIKEKDRLKIKDAIIYWLLWIDPLGGVIKARKGYGL